MGTITLTYLVQQNGTRRSLENIELVGTGPALSRSDLWAVFSQLADQSRDGRAQLEEIPWQ